MTARMLPPSTGALTITINGRNYTAPLNGSVDVPDHDGEIMSANGWIKAAGGGVGTTALRPVTPPKNTMFHDTTLGFNIVWNGKMWINPTSGAAV
jgi:hypothetical protein